MQILSIIILGLLLLICLVHILWSLGFKWGIKYAVPHQDNTPMFDPGRAITFIVAVLLLDAAVILMGQLNLYRIEFLDPMYRMGAMIWCFIFGARATMAVMAHTFNLVPESSFKHLDQWLYTPFCIITAGVFWLSL